MSSKVIQNVYICLFCLVSSVCQSVVLCFPVLIFSMLFYPGVAVDIQSVSQKPFVICQSSISVTFEHRKYTVCLRLYLFILFDNLKYVFFSISISLVHLYVYLFNVQLVSNLWSHRLHLVTLVLLSVSHGISYQSVWVYSVFIQSRIRFSDFL